RIDPDTARGWSAGRQKKTPTKALSPNALSADHRAGGHELRHDDPPSLAVRLAACVEGETLHRHQVGGADDDRSAGLVDRRPGAAVEAAEPFTGPLGGEDDRAAP